MLPRLRFRVNAKVSVTLAGPLAQRFVRRGENESGPRYVRHHHARALRLEGFCVLEDIGDGLRHGRRQFDAVLGLVVADLQAE